LDDWLEQTRIVYEDVHAAVTPDEPIWRMPNVLKLRGANGFMEGGFDWDKVTIFGYIQVSGAG
jgi:hypothetical protein